jgi:hypothetical protein
MDNSVDIGNGCKEVFRCIDAYFLPFNLKSKHFYLCLEDLQGGLLRKRVEVDTFISYKQKLIERTPVKLSLPLSNHFERVDVDYCEELVIFEADELRDIWVGLDFGKWILHRNGEFDGFGFLLPQIEECDVVVFEELDDLLVGYGFVEGFHELAHFDAGEDPLQSDDLVDDVVFKQIDLAVVGVAG